jgi:ribonuclease III
MPDLVVVLRTHSDVEAALVRGLLEAHGIEAMVSSNVPRAIFPFSASAAGEVRVAVRADEAAEARGIIDRQRVRDAAGPAQVLPWPDALSSLETRLGHRFGDREWLERALTHRSRAHEDPNGEALDNESLEFLGDAILGFVVADTLFREFPDFDEGQKSKVKAAVVSAQSLTQIAERLHLGEYLLLGRGEERTGGRQKQALLADACEALIAAVYLDGGIDAARGLIMREVGPTLERLRQPGLLTALTGDFKSALQERLQSAQLPPPRYRVVREEGPDHDKRFEIEVWSEGRLLATGDGRTKKDAEQQAACLALDAIDQGGLAAGAEAEDPGSAPEGQTTAGTGDPPSVDLDES